jgi:hypothetical protein
MKLRIVVLSGVLCAALTVVVAQSTAPRNAEAEPEISGTYTFLQEGEFVQIDAQQEKVGGFISRYSDSDKNLFLDHFIKQGTRRGRDLAFETQTVHGRWYGFKGRVERGAAKTRAEEGYWVLRGTLTEFNSDAEKKVTSRQREVTFNLFPDEEAAAEKRPPKN